MAVAYAVVAWLLVQIATQVFPFFEISNSPVRLIVILLLVGFPVVVAGSWAFGFAAGGSGRDENRRIPGRKLTALIVLLAAFAAGVTLFRFSTSSPLTIITPGRRSIVIPSPSFPLRT